MKLVTIDGSKAYTTTLLIAEGCEIEHRAVMKLLRTHHKTEILSAFEMSKVSRGGRPVEYAKLDELQTTFLITLMRNSVPVVKFKQSLAKEFFRQRATIAKIVQQRNDKQWKSDRAEGKAIHRQKTDVIERFVKYAIGQGSKSAEKYYMSLAKMENAAMFVFEQHFSNVREVLTIKQLMQVAVADDVIEKALEDGISQELPYKDCFKLAKERVVAFANIIGRSPVLDMGITTETKGRITNEQ